MIVVNVHLDSAVSEANDHELARVYIANVGGTDTLGNYKCVSLRGRSTAQLDKHVINRQGVINDHPRQREHVLHLVAKALNSMGYGK